MPGSYSTIISTESSSKGVVFSLVILIDKLKPVVAEKRHFDQRDISMMVAF